MDTNNTEYAALKREHAALKREHAALKREHAQIKQEHAILNQEYAENTIIMSMNDMRDKYIELEATYKRLREEHEKLDNETVSLNFYNMQNQKYKELHSKTWASVILIEYIISATKQYHNYFMSEGEVDILNLQTQLLVIKDLLSEK
jgi:predicted nuclease with TOPRIM domain